MPEIGGESMTKDQEMLQRMRETFMLKQMREHLKQETERLKHDTERLNKALQDAGFKFSDQGS